MSLIYMHSDARDINDDAKYKPESAQGCPYV